MEKNFQHKPRPFTRPCMIPFADLCRHFCYAALVYVSWSPRKNRPKSVSPVPVSGCVPLTRVRTYNEAGQQWPGDTFIPAVFKGISVEHFPVKASSGPGQSLILQHTKMLASDQTNCYNYCTFSFNSNLIFNLPLCTFFYHLRIIFIDIFFLFPTWFRQLLKT